MQGEREYNVGNIKNCVDSRGIEVANTEYSFEKTVVYEKEKCKDINKYEYGC